MFLILYLYVQHGGARSLFFLAYGWKHKAFFWFWLLGYTLFFSLSIQLYCMTVSFASINIAFSFSMCIPRLCFLILPLPFSEKLAYRLSRSRDTHQMNPSKCTMIFNVVSLSIERATNPLYFQSRDVDFLVAATRINCTHKNAR